MQNIHQNIRNAIIISSILFASFFYNLNNLLAGKADHPSDIDVEIAALVFLVVAAVGILYRSLAWKRNKNIRTYVNSQISRSYALDRIDYYLRTAPTINGMQYDNDFISGRDFFGLEFIEVKNIKGFRKSKKIHRKYFVPFAKSNYLDFIMNDKSIVSLSFFREYEVNNAIEIIKKYYPYMKEYKTYTH